MRKIEVSDILFWFFMLVLIGYIIGKLLGIINTPEWVSLLPLISLVFLIGISYQRIMNFMDRMFVRTDYLKNNLNNANEGILEIRNKLVEHDKRLSILEHSKLKLAK
ncbi:MAG: hypothetical protein AABX83_01775 [Nanoarchaeota archaeon]